MSINDYETKNFRDTVAQVSVTHLRRNGIEPDRNARPSRASKEASRNTRMNRTNQAMSDKEMCYVAADPEQPGAAWALCVDDPRSPWTPWTTEATFIDWQKAGARILFVDIDTGMSMLRKWKRPEFLPLLPEQQAVSDRINEG